MKELLAEFVGLVGTEKIVGFGRALLLVAIGWLVARVVSRSLDRLVGKRLKTHSAFLLRRAAFFVIFAVFLAAALHEVGFKLGLLFGAAGVLTVAIGFAAKSAASNLISGLFLIAEEPFEIGESIEVGSTGGEVLSIDLLSVKLKTFDGVFVRLPNEDLIASTVRNLSRLPLRRLDLLLGVAQGTDLDEVRSVLRRVAAEEPLSLSEPEPVLVSNGLGETSVDFRFSVWCRREDLLELRTRLYFEVPRALESADIEIPIPKRQIRIEESSESSPTA